MRLVESSGIVTASSDASNILIDCYDDYIESRGTILKFITWSDAFRKIGQIFEGVTVEFRQKLIMYSIEMVTNINLSRMIVVELLSSALRKKYWLQMEDSFFYLLSMNGFS